MPLMNPDESKLHRALWHTTEVLKVIRLLRGPLLAGTAAAVLLYLPDQMRELYRINAANLKDQGWGEILLGILALMSMFWTFWWISFEITQRCGDQVHKAAAPATWLLAILPALVGDLPLLSCALGLRVANPMSKSLTSIDMASPWQGTDKGAFVAKQLEILANTLNNAFIVFTCIAGVLFVAALWLQRNQTLKSIAIGRRHRFSGAFGLAASLAIFFGITMAVFLFPVVLPQAIGTMPLVALFCIPLVLFLGQTTFWHEKTGLPFLALLTLWAFSIAVLNRTDNHAIATVQDQKKAASPLVTSRVPNNVWESFQAWYEARPTRGQFKKMFPVYVVAAQGGGIYAAYHTATLLARLEDNCPEFRNHLFAISSVSGGSLGAAGYAGVTKALAQTPDTRRPDPRIVGATKLPCPLMEGPRPFQWQPGNHERAVRKILASDFLSPLVAATLFPDFLQNLLPKPVPALDRARWLEAAFEESWQQAEDGWQQEHPTGDNPFRAGRNPLRESFLNLWSPDGPAPALLINTTEADSGRRLVISPFQIEQQLRNSELLQFPLWNQDLFKPASQCEGLDISLSTAVSLSARFPWLTPAGSLTTDCRENGKLATSRLVDGGYFDNSGIDTALDVIKQIDDELAKTCGRLGDPSGPQIEIYLIVLNTSEFPERGSYGLGDELEPIRALLSTREARTPIAVTRAKRELGADAGLNAACRISESSIDRVHEARFSNPIYTMPLGWRLSTVSRTIIDMQSGRFWECDPDLNYNQQGEEFSNANCILMMVYHQLNETLEEQLKLLQLGEDWRRSKPDERWPKRVDHGAVVSCYGHQLKGLNRFPLEVGQKAAIEEVLSLWDANPQLLDDQRLALVLDFLYVKPKIPRRAGGCITERCALRFLQSSPELEKFSKPEPNGNYYYQRGSMPLRGPDDYRRAATVSGVPIYDKPDLLLVPEARARVLFAWMMDPSLSSSGNEEDELDSGFGEPKPTRLWRQCIERNSLR